MTETALTMPRRRLEAETIARAGAATALLGSALVHGAVANHHYQEWAVAGAVFLALQATETVLAMGLVLVWSRPVAIAVALSSSATVGLWLLSRTVGMPVGPAPFRQVEAIGVPDLVCCALELLAMTLVLPWALGRPTARARGMRAARFPGAGLPTPTTALAASVLVVGVLVVSVVGIRASVSDEPGGVVVHGAAALD